MEGSNHSSIGDDRPLIPMHSTPGQHQQIASPVSDFDSFSRSPRESRRVVLGEVQQEVDLAEQHRMPVQYETQRLPRHRNTVPVRNGMSEKEVVEVSSTVHQRLKATLKAAQDEQKKYAKRAYQAEWLVKIATFAQIGSNAIITGLSASTSNRHAQIGVSAMGAINTVISSFLVRVRGTREPERSKTHAENLEKFIRELESFMLDEGQSRDRKWDDKVWKFRTEFDRLQTAVHQSENGQPMSATPENPAPTAAQTPAKPQPIAEKV